MYYGSSSGWQSYAGRVWSKENEAVIMTDEGRKAFLSAWQQKKQEEEQKQRIRQQKLEQERMRKERQKRKQEQRKRARRARIRRAKQKQKRDEKNRRLAIEEKCGRVNY